MNNELAALSSSQMQNSHYKKYDHSEESSVI